MGKDVFLKKYIKPKQECKHSWIQDAPIKVCYYCGEKPVQQACSCVCHCRIKAGGRCDITGNTFVCPHCTPVEEATLTEKMKGHPYTCGKDCLCRFEEAKTIGSASTGQEYTKGSSEEAKCGLQGKHICVERAGSCEPKLEEFYGESFAKEELEYYKEKNKDYSRSLDIRLAKQQLREAVLGLIGKWEKAGYDLSQFRKLKSKIEKL